MGLTSVELDLMSTNVGLRIAGSPMRYPARTRRSARSGAAARFRAAVPHNAAPFAVLCNRLCYPCDRGCKSGDSSVDITGGFLNVWYTTQYRSVSSISFFCASGSASVSISKHSRTL